MLRVCRSIARSARALPRPSASRSYSSSVYGEYSSSSASVYGEVYAAYDSVSIAIPANASSSSSSHASDNNVRAPLSAMNRNARKPTKANHGARPNCHWNRKRSSPEFGSWHHAGLRPGQTPPPRPQPGTPITIATVGITGSEGAKSNNNSGAAKQSAQ